MELSGLLRPRAIAVVGATEKSGFGGDTCRNIITFSKDTDRVYFVNPKREQVWGKPCYKNLMEIPAPIDLAIICTPQKAVMSVMQDVAQKGGKGAVIFASGYKEAGKEGDQSQKELEQFCKEHNIGVMGPNCAGFANYIDGIFSFAFLVDERERRGSIGMISQSGQVCLSAMDKPGMGFSYIISSGNSLNVKVEDYLNFLVDDEDTKVVAAYIEGISRPEVLVEAFRKAAQKRKPIIVLKTGRSQRASQLASSHTGSLSGSDKAFDAVADKFGVIRVNDLQEFYGTANAFAILNHLPRSSRYVFMNVSGGEAGISADLAYLNGITLADMNQNTIDTLNEILPSFATATNPLDMTATLAYDEEKICKCMSLFEEDPGIDAMVMAYTITPDILDTTIWHLEKGIAMAKEQGVKKPVFWLPFIEHTRNKEVLDHLQEIGVPVLPSGQYGLCALKHVNRFLSASVNERLLELAIPNGQCSGEAIGYSEYDSMMILQAAGIDAGPQQVASAEEEAVAIGRRLGFPLALKIDSPDILHKSDVGGVKLNIRDENEMRIAYRTILENAAVHVPDARIHGILVKPMLDSGTEVIVGVNNDPQFGPMIMIGLGGIFVEIFKDVVLYPAPLNKAEAIGMIKRLKGYHLLAGYRGGKEHDIEALAEFVVNISEYACKNKDTLKELDINPLFVYEKGKGVSMADALILKYQENDDIA